MSVKEVYPPVEILLLSLAKPAIAAKAALLHEKLIKESSRFVSGCRRRRAVAGGPGSARVLALRQQG